jgi:hypothetical protein
MRAFANLVFEMDLWEKGRGCLDFLQIWRAVVNIFNKQSRAVDKEGASILSID